MPVATLRQEGRSAFCCFLAHLVVICYVYLVVPTFSLHPLSRFARGPCPCLASLDWTCFTCFIGWIVSLLVGGAEVLGYRSGALSSLWMMRLHRLVRLIHSKQSNTNPRIFFFRLRSLRSAPSYARNFSLFIARVPIPQFKMPPGGQSLRYLIFLVELS